MNATVVDLRYRMNDVLKALERKESVTVLYRGKVKGVLYPTADAPSGRVTEHPFFGVRESGATVDEQMESLRGGRYRAL
jgi:hypothetical protein